MPLPLRIRSLRLLPPRLPLLAALVALLGGALHAAPIEPPKAEEYRVYEAALAQLDSQPSPELHVAIYDRTLSGSCDSQAENPVLVKGCTFLWIKPELPADVEEMLRSHWRGFSKSAWKNFVLQNGASATLHEPIATPWKHRLVGGALTPEAARSAASPAGAAAEESDAAWRRPDMTIFLSRVGFNSKRTEAIVYVLVFSYQDQAAVTGDYLRFRAPEHAGAEKSWSMAGRVNYFTSGKGKVVRLEPPPETGNGGRMPLLRLAAERKAERK